MNTARSVSFSYAEQEELRDAPADRLVSGLSARWQRVFRRGMGDVAGYRARIELVANSLRHEPIPQLIPQIRVQLRKDGYTEALVEQCLALCAIGLEGAGLAQPSAASYAAAAAQLGRRIVGMANDVERRQALMLAAMAAALRGEPVHVLAASDARAVVLGQQLGNYAQSLGLETGIVVQGMDLRSRLKAYGAALVCSTVREIGTDYLRDRLRLGARQGELSRAVMRLSGDAPPNEQLLLGGLHCALVEDADLVTIDDARVPLLIAAEADQSRERLLYEQALELARALHLDRDFTVADEIELTEQGRERLALLVSPLGGIWAARNRREVLIVIALRALHEFVRQRDYQVVQGRVIFPAPTGAEGTEPTEGDVLLQKLTEIKEGCALSGRRDVLARVSVPRFLNRYFQMGGVCADVNPIAGELWSLYGLHVRRDSIREARQSDCARVFASGSARMDAIVRCAREALQGGYSLVIALRTQPEAQNVMELLAAAGVQPGIFRGIGDVEDEQALAALSVPGTVLVSCHPAERGIARVARATDVPVQLTIAELHDARRHVRMLRRVFGASRCEILLALDDQPVEAYGPTLLKLWAYLSAGDLGEAAQWPSRRLVDAVQKAMEQEQRVLRGELQTRDVYLDDLLAFGGRSD